MDQLLQAIVRRAKQGDAGALIELPTLIDRYRPTERFACTCAVLVCLGFDAARRVVERHFPTLDPENLSADHPAKVVSLVRLLGGGRETILTLAEQAFQVAASVESEGKDQQDECGRPGRSPSSGTRSMPAECPSTSRNSLSVAVSSLADLRSASADKDTDETARKCLMACSEALSEVYGKPGARLLGHHLAAMLLPAFADFRPNGDVLPFGERKVSVEINSRAILLVLHTDSVGPQRPLQVPLPSPADFEDSTYWAHRALSAIEATTFHGLDYTGIDGRLFGVVDRLPRSLADLAELSRSARHAGEVPP